jgi:hypothetical protein
MAKEKKIGIKFFLNKKLKSVKNDGIVFHPLYVRIHFNGQNTNFPVWLPSIFAYYHKTNDQTRLQVVADGDYLDEKGFQELIEDRKDKYVREALEKYEDEFRKIIRFEYKMKGEKFTLKGFHDRYIKYIQLFNPFGEKNLIQRFTIEIKDNNLPVPNEVLIFFSDHFVEKFYQSIGQYTDGEPSHFFSKDLLNKMVCYISMKSFSYYSGDQYSLFDWITDTKLQEDFLNFLFEVKNDEHEDSTDIKERFPIKLEDPFVIMGTMKKWLLQ